MYSTSRICESKPSADAAKAAMRSSWGVTKSSALSHPSRFAIFCWTAASDVQTSRRRAHSARAKLIDCRRFVACAQAAANEPGATEWAST